MTGHPAAMLAVLGAGVFLATFSAVAALRPDRVAVTEDAWSAGREVSVDTIIAPLLSPVVALPELRRPKARRTTGAARPPAPPATPAPAATPTPVPPAADACHAARRHARSSARRHARSSARRHAGPAARRHASPSVNRRPGLRQLGMMRLGWIAAGLAVALVAGFGGWFAADRVTGEPEGAPPDATVLDAGPARLKVSLPWQPAPRPPALPGLPGAPAWAPRSAPATTVSVALLPADHPSLLPAAMVAQTAGGLLPEPATATVAGLQARSYRGVVSGGSVLDVYAIPTTRGVLTLVCTNRSASRGAGGVPRRARAGHRAGRAALRPGCEHGVPDAGAGDPVAARRRARA